MPHLIGVASGKGGVGKTTFSVNLAMALAQSNVGVALVDGDMGLANAQLHLNVRAKHTLSDHLMKGVALSDVGINVRENLRLFPGSSGDRAMANLPIPSLVAMVEDLKEEITADCIIIDIAAGISDQILEILNLCDSKMIVMTDEPTSIADAYGLTKLIHQREDIRNVYLIPNQVSSPEHGRKVFDNMNKLTLNFLSMPLGYLGSIEADTNVVKSIKQRIPLKEISEESIAWTNICQIAEETLSSLIASIGKQALNEG